MRNQIDAATRAGVRAATINSTNREEWDQVGRRLAAGDLDVLLISPERLSNEEFLTGTLLPHAHRIGMLIVDEAHCISDWGHDFRPDYRRIVGILARLPPGVPVCATTATANDRVVADVGEQLGRDLVRSRGPLVRESLRLQTVPLPSSAAKLAWLTRWLPNLNGSGIVYALTVRWAELIASWLQVRGLSAAAYHAKLTDEERQAREGRLLANELKALVATTALGMGYDKPDLGFVVHFHQPGSVVHYYQQVGRAGRAIERAYGIMLAGGDDRAINDYFIDTAFPPESEVALILAALEAADEGLTPREIEAAVNLSRGRIALVLKSLAVESPAPLALIDARWRTTANLLPIERRRALIARRTELRRREQAQMEEYLRHEGCLMEFLARALDDPAARPCGCCANCRGRPDAMRQVPQEAVIEAETFLRGCDLPIEPRKQWVSGAFPTHGWSGNIREALQGSAGRALCVLGETEWGGMVEQGKYRDGYFADALAEALAGLIRRHPPAPPAGWVTCVPSSGRPGLVSDLAARVASRLGLPFVPAVRKMRETRPQKEMENSWHQAHNRDGCFAVDPWPGLADPVILIDDIVDSRWTFTVVAALLRQAGCRAVTPFALAANRAR
jgi:ATP-dependent DNA helicase RecQ